MELKEKTEHVYTRNNLPGSGYPPPYYWPGGGYVGLEFASMYAEFSKVAILEGGKCVHSTEDRDIMTVYVVLERE